MGFVSKLLGTNNDFQASRINTSNVDMTPFIQQAIGQLQGPDQANQAGAQQQALIQSLQAQAAGQGPNLAETQLQAATDRNNQQAAGLIASQRGLNPALAARQILMQQAQAQQGTANQAAQLRQQQQLAAQQLLGGTLGQTRGQDLQQQQTGYQNVGILGQLQNQQNNIATNYDANLQGLNAKVAEQNQHTNAGILGGLFQGAGAVGQYAMMGAGGGPTADLITGSDNVGAGAGSGALAGMQAGMFSEGGPVEGEPRVEGDSPENDTVPALLSPGEVVIPRSLVERAEHEPHELVKFVLQSKMKDQSKTAFSDGGMVKSFIDGIKAHKTHGPASGYARVLLAKQK